MNLKIKRTTLLLLVAGLLAATATAVLSRNLTAGNKVGESPKAVVADRKEIMSPIMVTISGMPGKGMHDTSAAAFQYADRDRNGTLTLNEAKALPHVGKNFNLIDTDHDGMVSLAEDQAYIQTYRKTARK